MTAPFPSPTKQWHTDTYKAISPSRPELSLKGKVVVVTGGGAGIGARTTRSFAEAGAAHIAILGRRKAVLESTAAEIRSSFPNTKIHTFSADITDKKAIDKVFHDFSEAVGKIDVLVSNAAAGDVEPSIKDLDPEAWFSIVETNIKGPLVLAQAFLAYGKEDGVIINVTSGLSFLFGPGMSAYCVSKEAAVRFFQIVGMENPKLRVVHVQPGVILTDMNKKSGMPAQDEIALPADFMVWLSSPEASFLSGKYTFANWDVEELKALQGEIKEKRLLEMYLTGLDFMPAAA